MGADRSQYFIDRCKYYATISKTLRNGNNENGPALGSMHRAIRRIPPLAGEDGPDALTFVHDTLRAWWYGIWADGWPVPSAPHDHWHRPLRPVLCRIRAMGLECLGSSSSFWGWHHFLDRRRVCPRCEPFVPAHLQREATTRVRHPTSEKPRRVPGLSSISRTDSLLLRAGSQFLAGLPL